MARRNIRRRRGLGNVDASQWLDQAFVSAEDNDCERTVKNLDRAESAGANVAQHRKQLLQDCKTERGTSMFGVRDELDKEYRRQKDQFVNWRTGLALVLGVYIGSKVLR